MTEQDLLAEVNKTPALLSVLYDLDLMPEQCKRGTMDWKLMMFVIVGFIAGRDDAAKKDKQ